MSYRLWRRGSGWLGRIFHGQPILAVEFTGTLRTKLPEPSRSDIVAKRSAIGAGRPRAIISSGIAELALAATAGEGKPGAAAGGYRFKSLNFPIVTVPRILHSDRLHLTPAS